MKKNRFIIFAKASCTYCEAARLLLEEANLPYTTYYTDDTPFAKEFLTYSGFKKVPQIYYNGRHIGGYEELENFIGVN